MRLILPAFLLAVCLATPALAQEPTVTPDEFGTGAIAEVCQQKFPGDAEASKACEVTIRVIIDHEVDVRIDRLQMLVDYLMATDDVLTHKIVELERRVAELESPSPKNEPSAEPTPALDCENTRVYLSIDARRRCREERDERLNFVPVPK